MYKRVCTAIFLLIVALAAHAQAGPRVFRVAHLSLLTPADGGTYLLDELTKSLASRGYVEGRNLIVDSRYAEYDAARLPRLVRELEALKPDVIVTVGTLSLRAIHDAGTVIPVVMSYCHDPIAMGVIRDAVRPGGNVTGICFPAGDAPFVKTIDVARELAPQAKRLALLKARPGPDAGLDELRRGAGSRGIQVVELVATTPQELEGAFAEMRRQRFEIAIVDDQLFFIQQRHRIAELAIAARIATVHMGRFYADAGGLVSYSPSLHEQANEAADYVDRILRGARPGDLPVQSSRSYELVINARTARRIGFTVPQGLLMRADEVIE